MTKTFKKIVFSVIAVIVFSGFTFADFGISAKLGTFAWDSNFDKIKRISLPGDKSSTSFDDENFSYNISLYYEKGGAFNLSKNSYAGIKIGYTVYSKNNIRINYSDATRKADLNMDIKASAVPVICYYKYKTNKILGLFCGAGFSFLTTGFEYDTKREYDDGYSYEYENFSSTKENFIIMPEIEAGIEVYLLKGFCLFADIEYKLNGKAESDTAEKFYKDYSGLSANVGIKLNIF